MLERLKNFALHGVLATNEDLGKPPSLMKQAKEKEARVEKLEPVTLSKEDRKALLIATVQVLGPIFLVVLLIVVGLLYFTAR